SLSLILLDKLGDPLDVPLIDALATRIMEEQTHSGGLSYAVTGPDENEQARIQAYLKKVEPLRGKTGTAKEAKKPRTFADITPEYRRRLMQIVNRPLDQFSDVDRGDNSNTQFAMVA